MKTKEEIQNLIIELSIVLKREESLECTTTKSLLIYGLIKQIEILKWVIREV